MNFYVNLPISWAYRDNKWVDLLLKKHLNPELGLDIISCYDVPLSWHKPFAAKLHGEGLNLSVHLPFMLRDHEGKRDLTGKVTMSEALDRGSSLAEIYAADHMVAHPYYRRERLKDYPTETSLSLVKHDGYFDEWLASSLKIWQVVLENCKGNLYLENIYEASPAPIMALALELEKNFAKRVGICFDIGHWYAFSFGKSQNNLVEWLNNIAPCISHMHLHDNHGSIDEHLGIGTCSVPFDLLFSHLLELGLCPSVTLEPHDVSSLEQSLKWLSSSETYAKWLAVCNKK